MWARSLIGVSAAGASVALVPVAGHAHQRRRKHGPKPPTPARCDEASLRTASQALLTPMVHYAELHGLLYKDKDTADDPSKATQCPVSMFPFKIPAQAFHESVALSPLWNQLVDNVARDRTWLYDVLKAVETADPFTGRLMEISKAVHNEGLRQPMMLGIHRSDYMLHEPNDIDRPRFLQVELNTIASSMASHSANTEALHRFMMSRYATGNDDAGRALSEHFGVKGAALWSQLPENRTLKDIPEAIAKAHHEYRRHESSAGLPVVLMVVQGDERNFADQRCIEYALWEQHGVPMVRATLADVCCEGRMDAAGRLRLAGKEISVVYFRAGYSPDDYPSETEWEGRMLLERSLAIKSPSVDYQLVGAKKVQQALALPGCVERFVGARDGATLRASFAGLWGLGPGEDDEGIIAKALKNPDAYVLKPQREGGGNNYYGEGLAKKLEEIRFSEERGAYILMQRIMPQLQTSVMTREGKVTVMPGLSEFGFYSVYLGDGKNVRLSQHAGHLVRTKGEGVDEGGVAAGYAVISSPFLSAE